MDILKNLSKEDLSNISFSALSRNPNITEEFIEENIDQNWDWFSLTCNPSLSCDFFEKHIDKVNFSALSSRTFI